MPSFYFDPTQEMTIEHLNDAYEVREKIRARAEAKDRHIRATGGGPRTPEGKAISARNAIRHGFASVNPVISIEDQAAARGRGR